MENKILLEHGNFYHVYNSGNNREVLFRETTNYEYFIRLYERYISPIARTYAWCLMGNHFHFLIEIKDEKEFLDLQGLQDLGGLKKIKPPHQYFSNLFNAYTKAYNKKYNRTGSLFTSNFKRKQVTNHDYLINLIIYIHTNPIHHGFSKLLHEYPWTSYHSVLSHELGLVEKKQILT